MFQVTLSVFYGFVNKLLHNNNNSHIPNVNHKNVTVLRETPSSIHFAQGRSEMKHLLAVGHADAEWL